MLGQQQRQQREQPGEQLMQGEQEVGNAHGGIRPVGSAGENSRRFAGLGDGADGTGDGATKRPIQVPESPDRSRQDASQRGDRLARRAREDGEQGLALGRKRIVARLKSDAWQRPGRLALRSGESHAPDSSREASGGPRMLTLRHRLSRQCKENDLNQHNPNPGGPFQPPAPRPGETPSPVRDTPPWQPSDPVFPPADPGVNPDGPQPADPAQPSGP
jgi:hypothetical protein